ncbi:hypothetical protein [Desulfosporosinus hippei]|uniref:Uncharacterized protein n=1 Tax=Desulfosporosinus hippei DSM 8344 TaxID=1121419 RepID=A0A1G7RKG6_9FIRM|nr:hypothetical protein [Desulfosporosinus hippei]SDG11256.1 hypothetical protein SAMN05443529_101112 [Desulfosporosinus hippei DSM 8344]
MNAMISLLLIFLIVIVIVFFIPVVRAKLFTLLSWKITLTLAGLYLGILMMIVPILYILPENCLIKNNETKDQVVATSQNLISDLYNKRVPSERDLSKLEGIYKNSSHTFNADSNHLSVNIQASTGSRHVFIERKAVDDGQIGVSSYATAQYIGDVNFTKLISPPTFTLQNGTLSLKPPGHQILNFKQLNADFTINQFSNRNYAIHELSTNFGEQIVYIRVPKSLVIDKGQHTDQIQMVDPVVQF